jgi:hypothetical protein
MAGILNSLVWSEKDADPVLPTMYVAHKRLFLMSFCIGCSVLFLKDLWIVFVNDSLLSCRFVIFVLTLRYFDEKFKLRCPRKHIPRAVLHYICRAIANTFNGYSHN